MNWDEYRGLSERERTPPRFREYIAQLEAELAETKRKAADAEDVKEDARRVAVLYEVLVKQLVAALKRLDYVISDAKDEALAAAREAGFE